LADHGFEALCGGEVSIAEETLSEAERLAGLGLVLVLEDVVDGACEGALLEELLEELAWVAGIGLTKLTEGIVELA
jgi:hypothetical protein